MEESKSLEPQRESVPASLTVAQAAGEKTMEGANEAQAAKKAKIAQQRRETMARAREKQKAKRSADAQSKAERVLNAPPEPEQKSPAASIPDPEIHWFTDVDLNQKGAVANDFAAWYDEVAVEMLREEVRGLESQMDRRITWRRRQLLIMPRGYRLPLLFLYLFYQFL